MKYRKKKISTHSWSGLKKIPSCGKVDPAKDKHQGINPPMKVVGQSRHFFTQLCQLSIAIFLCLSLFCYALLRAHSSFAIILKRKRNVVALLLLSYRCIVTLNVRRLFLTVHWVGLQYVIMIYPDHTRLFLYMGKSNNPYPLH